MLFSCGSNILYQNTWAENPINIDGDYQEWTGNLEYIEDSNISYGFKNDDNYIYICMISANQRFNRDIFMNGLTFWFDTKGKKNKRYGIKFPIGVPMELRKNMMRREKEGNSYSPHIQTEFEFFTGKDEKTIYPLYNNEKNIELILSRNNNNLVYELKVPFSALLKNENDIMAVGMELGKMVRGDLSGAHGQESMGKGRGSQGGGGRRGSGGRGGGGRGGMSSGNRPSKQRTQTSFEKWIKINLSKKTVSTGEIK